MTLRQIPPSEITRLAKQLRLKVFGKKNKKLSLKRYESYVQWLLTSQGGSCLLAGGSDDYCWNAPKFKDLLYLKLEWARKVPGASGGKYRLKNLALMCTRCNNQIQTSRTLPQLLEELTHKAAVIAKM